MMMMMIFNIKLNKDLEISLTFTLSLFVCFWIIHEDKYFKSQSQRLKLTWCEKYVFIFGGIIAKRIDIKEHFQISAQLFFWFLLNTSEGDTTAATTKYEGTSN